MRRWKQGRRRCLKRTRNRAKIHEATYDRGRVNRGERMSGCGRTYDRLCGYTGCKDRSDGSPVLYIDAIHHGAARRSDSSAPTNSRLQIPDVPVKSRLGIVYRCICHDILPFPFNLSRQDGASCEDDQHKQNDKHNNQYSNTPITPRRYHKLPCSIHENDDTHFRSSV